MADLLNVGISGVKGFEALLGTCADNITNQMTPGYCKQTTELKTAPALFVGGNYIGSGVQVGMTSRSYEPLTRSLNRQNIATENQLSTSSTFVDQINQLLSDENIGIDQALDNFYSALQGLSAAPGSTVQRGAVLDEAKSLQERINTLDVRLNDLQHNIYTQKTNVINQINSIANSIANVNKDILANGSNANYLLNQRDLLVDKLSALVTTQVNDNNNGTVNVFIGGGQSLVVGNSITQLGTQNNADDPSAQDVVIVTPSATQVVTSNIYGGQVSGLDYAKSAALDLARANLNRIALAVSLSINAQHKLGIDLQGKLGGDFFNDLNTITMQLARALPSSNNLGDATFAVRVNDIARVDNGPHKVSGTDSALVNSGSLTPLYNNSLIINNIKIRPTVAGDDTTSTTDNSASAIALAKVVNASANSTGVTAAANPNTLYLGAFSVGAFGAGDFNINGYDIITTGANETTLLQDINAMSVFTGVKAFGDGNLNITLLAEDGRNIRLQSNTNTPVATFQYFDTSSATALDKVKRSSITLNSTTTPIDISGNTVGNAGLVAGQTPALPSSLSTSDYILSYDGVNYILQRLDDLTTITSNIPDITTDGISISFNGGSIIAGDQYIIRPTVGAAANFGVAIANNAKLAMASPIGVSKGNNTGTGVITRGKVLNTSGIPTSTATFLGNAFGTPNALSPPLHIVFDNDTNGDTTIYRVYNSLTGAQIGTEQTFVPNTNNNIFPMLNVMDPSAAGPTQIYDPGYRITISGAPQQGDTFYIKYNAGAIADNANVVEMLKLSKEKILDDQQSSINESYAATVAQVGVITQTIKTNSEAAAILQRQSQDRVDSISGVNLDEEATNLIRLQQGYKASARILAVASANFDTIIAAVASAGR